MTKAVVEALRERLECLRADQLAQRKERAERLIGHGKRFAALPVLDPRSTDELLGYDEIGLLR